MSGLTVGIIPCSPAFTENRLFDIKATRDCALERFVETKRLLEQHAITCRTSDMLEHQDIDVLLFHHLALEFNDILSVIKANPGVWLLNIPLEPSMTAPLHHELVLQRVPFDRVLTWNDKLVVRGDPFIKANIGEPVIDADSIPARRFEDKLFMGCVYSNKSSHEPNSLYQERIRAIEFFSRQQEKMDLYGIGWDSSTLAAVRRSYKGTCVRKRDVLKQYKFSLCFENTKNDAGLITEKIFDCFAAGTVPIYYGAPNIQDYIPRACFIDFREFHDYDELYRFMVEMSEEKYQTYMDAAKAFIRSPQYHAFTSKCFAETILEQVQDLKDTPLPHRSLWKFKYDVLRAVLHYPPRSVKNFLRYLRFLFKFSLAR